MSRSEDTQFSNPAMAPEDVPDYRDAELEPLAAAFRIYTLISTLVFATPVVIAGLIVWVVPFIPLPGWTLLVAGGGVLLSSTLVAIYRWLGARYRGWALRRHDIIARAGVLWRGTTVLPFARIQHVETTHGPLERAYGLARLKLYTAGGLTADLIVIGLERATADRLREFLVEEIRKRDAETSRAGDA